MVKDTLWFIDKIIEYIDLMDNEVRKLAKHNIPLEDYTTLSLVSFYLLQIGEQVAAGKLKKTLGNIYDDVPWSSIYGLRNVITHAYHNVDLSIIINTYKNKVPIFKMQLLEIKNDLEKK